MPRGRPNKEVSVPANNEERSARPLLECSICNRAFGGIGNSADPVNNGRCCDACNTFVIWMRMQHLRSNA